MKKYDTVIFLLLAALVFSIPTGFAFASEVNDDDRYDDDDRHDDDRYDDDDRHDKSKTSDFFKREVRAETLGFQTEIKIEIEFVSNTTDTNQLIDEIIEKFSLTKAEADNELRMGYSDDRRLEKKFEVEIEKRGNTAKVEVELETVVDSTSRGDILNAIVKNSQLTKEQISQQLRFDSDDSASSRNEIRESSDSSELEKLRQENQQLREEIDELYQKLDDMQLIIMEQMKVIMDTLAELKSQ